MWQFDREDCMTMLTPFINIQSDFIALLVYFSILINIKKNGVYIHWIIGVMVSVTIK